MQSPSSTPSDAEFETPQSRSHLDTESRHHLLDDQHKSLRRPIAASRFARLRQVTRILSTVAVLAAAAVAGLVIWKAYVTAPWTRDGRVRVQVANVAPQVSGEITGVAVADNSPVRKGDVLYVIDQFDYQTALDMANAQLRMRTADLQVKQLQSQRREHLTDLTTSSEEKQQYLGQAVQAEASVSAAEAQARQADMNLRRTVVRSPVNGAVTNLLMRVGDYAHAGVSNISIVDTDSFWVDGYFEETKLPHLCVGERAEAWVMGYDQPVIGRVESVSRGISVTDAAPSTQGLPNVNPIYTWVRLAQRVPVRIRITDVPAALTLVSGMTATVAIGEGGDRRPWHDFGAAMTALRNALGGGAAPSPACTK